MSVPLSTIFSWFETGDFPTQEQFQATFSSFRHKADKIQTNEVQGLIEIFQNLVSTEMLESHLKDSGAHAEHLAQKNGDNIEVSQWKQKLGIELIATVDTAADSNDGNVYTKEQITEIVEAWKQRVADIESMLQSDDVSLDEMQEIVNYIKENKAAIIAIQEAGLGTVDDSNVNLTDYYQDFGSPKTQRTLNIKFAEIITALQSQTFTETQTTIGTPVLENGVLKIYYTGENGNLQEQTVDLNELAETFAYLNHVEEEISVTQSMISGSTVKLILGQIINPAKEVSVYYNGVFIPKSMRYIEPANNSVIVDLAALNMDVSATDFIVVKYHKIN